MTISTQLCNHSLQIPKASPEAITFFLFICLLFLCLCLPHNTPPRRWILPIRRDTLNMEQPSHLCLVEKVTVPPPRHTEEEANGQAKKLTAPTSVCANSCANTNGFCWETTSHSAHCHHFLLELWGISQCLSYQSSH